MYKVVATTESAALDNGAKIVPVLTLEDDSGGRYHIAVDDRCFVLYCERDGKCHGVTHWFEEATAALVDLGISPDEASAKLRKPRLRVVD